jgi:hypothetical protein
VAGITGSRAVAPAGTAVILDVMDDMQHAAPVGQQSPGSTQDAREAGTAVLGSGRLLANPRRVRRA